MNQGRSFDELRGKFIDGTNAQKIRDSYPNLTTSERRRLEVILRSAVVKRGEIK